MEFAVRTSQGADEVLDLAREGDAEGHAFVSRLVSEWHEGINRFDKPGEGLFVATAGGRVVGVCGLNRDPYVSDSTIARVRHLYVAPTYRRRGIGSGLVGRIVWLARGSFEMLRLRTHDPEAARFYERLGFHRVDGDQTCTHRLELS